MKIWDRGRLAEFGLDLRGTWVHAWAEKMFRKDVPDAPRKLRSEMTKEDLVLAKAANRQAALACFCEPCVREFLPWPLNWS